MSISDYILAIGMKSADTMKLALYHLLRPRYSAENGPIDELDFAGKLAAEVANYVFEGAYIQWPGSEFATRNRQTIEAKAAELRDQEPLCRALTCAVYNFSYAKYVERGKKIGILFHPFLAYVRALQSNQSDVMTRLAESNRVPAESYLPLLHLSRLGLMRELPSTPDSKRMFETVASFADIVRDTSGFVATADERDRMVAQKDPKTFQEYLELRDKLMAQIKQEWPWLDFGGNWLPHDYQFDSPYFFDFLKKRKYVTYHDAQMDGYVPRVKDFALLYAEFFGRMGLFRADQELIASLRRGKTNDGAPLVMGDNSRGYELVGLREFKPIESNAFERLKADDSLQRRLASGTVFEAQSGAYVELIEVYAHPDIAAHLKKTIANSYSTKMMEWKRRTRKPSAARTGLNFIRRKTKRDNV